MDFTHKFASGPMPIDRLISEYFNPGKMRRNGSQAAYAGKRYSNPPFNFKEQDFLNKFKYLYPIGREYEIPREDRQKVIGTSNVNTYKRQITEAINLQSWNDLLRFEKEHPGTLALVPGPCQVCERTHEGCTRPKNQPCRHMDMMRFSLEGLGIDADTMAKFEMGLLPKWPDDGKLPQKLTAVMGILSNELIPMEEIKAFFPDAEKNFLNLAERENLDPNLLSPEIKRQSSWLDNQVRQRKALEEAEAKRLQAEQQASLPSEHLKDAPKPESELPTEHIGNKTFEAGMPNEHIVQKGSQPDAFDEDENTQAEEEEDEDKKYKWLGFKRSMDEVNQNFYNRPIPKFNVPDEEEESEEAADEEAPENTEAAVPEEAAEEAAPDAAAEPAPAAEPEAASEEEDDDSGLNYSFKRPIFDDEVPNAGGIPKWKTNPALLPDEEEEEAPAETAPEPQAVMEEFISETAPEPEVLQPSAPAPDTMQSLLESLDVDMLKKVLAAKLMESGEMTAQDLRAQREREAEQAREREREERRAALEDAMNQKRAEAEARAREEQEAAEREAARLKAEEEAREAERVRKQEELEGMLRARLEEERARIEEEKRVEAEKKAEEERIQAEEAAKKAEEERLAREEQARIEAQKLPEVSGLENVLGMALNIAKQVSRSDEPEAEEGAEAEAAPAEAPQATKVEEKRQPVRHSYKWLNYKSELPDDEDEPLKDWKDR